MTVNRRLVLAGALAAPGVIASARWAAAAPARTLKLAHPFRTSTDDGGDLRDRLCRKFAAELESRSNGEIAVQVSSDAVQRDTLGQFAALRKGNFDFSLYPISDAGEEFAELDIGLMPGLVTSYRQGAAWKSAPVGRTFEAFLADKGVVILSWIWLAGGTASRTVPIVAPEDAKGLKVRSGHHQMDMVLQAAGATPLSLRTNAIHPGMQAGTLDAALTSSTSLMGFRLEQISKGLTTGRGTTYWYILVPLIMSKQTYDVLPANARDVIRALGIEMEQFALTGAMADDQKVADLYAKHGARVVDLDAATVAKWRARPRGRITPQRHRLRPNCSSSPKRSTPPDPPAGTAIPPTSERAITAWGKLGAAFLFRRPAIRYLRVRKGGPI
jgi:TRAP-type C4-dicarboxylate transport system substrate-binding protein